MSDELRSQRPNNACRYSSSFEMSRLSYRLTHMEAFVLLADRLDWLASSSRIHRFSTSSGGASPRAGKICVGVSSWAHRWSRNRGMFCLRNPGARYETENCNWRVGRIFVL